MMTVFWITAVSFAVGYAMKRGGLCTYAAVTQWVHERRLERLVVFAGIAAWAGVTLFVLEGLFVPEPSVSKTHSHIALAAAAGAVIGLGAFLNRGCFFGTFVALVSGNVNYLATLAGLAVGVGIAKAYLLPSAVAAVKPSLYESLGQWQAVWVGFLALAAIYIVFAFKSDIGVGRVIFRLTSGERLESAKLLAMITIGVGGAALYGYVKGWNYADVLRDGVLSYVGLQERGPSKEALMSVSALIAGGITAAVRSDTFVFTEAKGALLIGCFTGGLLMGGASMLLPGGNDGMILKGIPVLALHACVGFASMLFSMWAAVYLFRNKSHR